MPSAIGIGLFTQLKRSFNNCQQQQTVVYPPVFWFHWSSKENFICKCFKKAETTFN